MNMIFHTIHRKNCGSQAYGFDPQEVMNERFYFGGEQRQSLFSRPNKVIIKLAERHKHQAPFMEYDLNTIKVIP